MGVHDRLQAFKMRFPQLGCRSGECPNWTTREQASLVDEEPGVF